MNVAIHPITMPQLSKRFGVRLSTRTRLWASGVGALNMGLFLALFWDSSTFEAGRYRFHREVMPIAAWAGFWLVASLLCLASILTRSVRLWIATSIFAMMCAAGWTACLLFAKVMGEYVSGTSLSLWSFVIFSYAMGIMSPIQVEGKTTYSDPSRC